MACETVNRQGQSLVQRQSAVKLALARLEAALKRGKARVVISPSGAITFAGWQGEERDDVTDACAFRKLTAANSWELRQAIARAEAQQGRKVNVRVVASGVHSHDNGKTWGPGHKH